MVATVVLPQHWARQMWSILKQFQSLCCLYIWKKKNKGLEVTALLCHHNPWSKIEAPTESLSHVYSSCLLGDNHVFLLHLIQNINCMVGCFICFVDWLELPAHLCQKLGRFTEPLLQLSLVFSAEHRPVSVIHLKGAAAASLYTSNF